jgi:hypothetical protein
MQLKPLDLVLAVVDQLTPKELEQVHHRMCSTPCERTGHKFKAVGTILYWFAPSQTKLVCTACGATRMV